MNKTKAEQIAQIPYEEIAKLSGEEGKKILQGYVQTLRTGYIRREQSFKKRKVFSYAADALGKTRISKMKVEEMSWPQLQYEFVRYAKFFNDATSSLAGIERVNREQDLRIFGQDARGKPLRRMTEDQRKKYWKLYKEFENQKPLLVGQSYSEAAQQQLAQALFKREDDIEEEDDTKIPNPDEDEPAFIDYVERKIKESYTRGPVDAPSILSGQGNIDYT